jgi:type I restriction enzyme M protein
VLPKDYARPGLDKRRLGELIDLIGTIGLGDATNRFKDILGRVYEYFLGQFASAEGKRAASLHAPPRGAPAGRDAGAARERPRV